MEQIWAQTRQKSSHKTLLNSLGHQRPVVAKVLLSERFSNGFWGLEVLLFSGFINIVFILIYEFMN